MSKMKTYIALFRGINVGGKNILPMKGLTELLVDIGCQNVKTYIQSGNVVFQIEKERGDNLAEKIGQKVLKHYNFEPKIFLLEPENLEAVVRENPFATEDGKALHFFFLESPAKAPDMKRLAAFKSGTEEFKLCEKVFYFYAPDGIGRSKLAAKVENSLGVPLTARNWNTVSKLLEMVKQ